VQDTVRIVLTLDGPAPSEASIEAGNVVLAFGSPTLLPEPSAALLLGVGALFGLGATGLRRR
jgi:hypothetical protein